MGLSAVLATFLTSGLVHGATITLNAFIYNSPGAILSSNGVPLADGSIIQVIGSDDNSADGFVGTGRGFNPFEVASGETLIGSGAIDSTISSSNGTFYIGGLEYDNTTVNYLYLRVFDSAGPLTGMINYAYSSVVEPADDALGGSALFQDFGGGFSTTNFANFVVIPEPGTSHLLLLFVAILFGMRISMRRRREADEIFAGEELRAASDDHGFVEPRDWI